MVESGFPLRSWPANAGPKVQILYSAPYGDMAELADALDLGSNVERREGSSPSIPTQVHGER